jgi:hypothetical protein
MVQYQNERWIPNKNMRFPFGFIDFKPIKGNTFPSHSRVFPAGAFKENTMGILLRREDEKQITLGV